MARVNVNIHVAGADPGGVPRVPWNPLLKSLLTRDTLIEQSNRDTLIEQSQWSFEEQCSKLYI